MTDMTDHEVKLRAMSEDDMLDDSAMDAAKWGVEEIDMLRAQLSYSRKITDLAVNVIDHQSGELRFGRRLITAMGVVLLAMLGILVFVAETPQG